MDITRLLTLRALARNGTMAAAARALHLTPSAVSQQLAQLEHDAGTALTERRGRGVTLTPAGEALVVHAERLMAVLDEAKSELAQLRGEIAGELRVAAFPSIAVAVIAQTARALQAAFPRLQVIIEEREPQESLTALGAWQIDVAVIDDLAAVSDKPLDRYAFVPLAQDTLHVLLPVTHPLAGRSALAVADLRHEWWALDSTSSSFGEFIANLCRRSGFVPSINAHCIGFEMVAAMVASGCSVSIVSGLRLVRQIPDVRAVPLRPEIRRKILVAYRKGEHRHPAVQAFLDEVARTAERILLLPTPGTSRS